MCNMFALVWQTTLNQKASEQERVRNMVCALVALAARRGKSAIGITAICKDGQLVESKQLTDGCSALRKQTGSLKALLGALKTKDIYVLLGHARNQGTGSNTLSRVHPFRFPEILPADLVGMYTGKVIEYVRFRETESKSHTGPRAFIRTLTRCETSDELVTHLHTIKGRFAAVLASKEGVVVTRNSGENLFVTSESYGKFVCYASEADMLHAALTLSQQPYGPVLEVPPNKLVIHTAGSLAARTCAA